MARTLDRVADKKKPADPKTGGLILVSREASYLLRVQARVVPAASLQVNTSATVSIGLGW